MTVDPLILEGTDDAPAKESDDAVADVLLRLFLQVTEVGCKDDALVIGAKVLPDLLLWTNVFHDQKEVLDETLTMS